MVYRNGFELDIIGNDIDVFSRNGFNYYALKNHTKYKIVLKNSHRYRCDVTVRIDGNNIGTWRINPHSRIFVERPATIDREFVFVSENSNEAMETGSVSGLYTNGNISACFKLENCIDEVYDCDLSYGVSNTRGVRGCDYIEKGFGMDDIGVTILGDGTGQRFRRVNKIHNYTDITNINVKLVVKDESKSRYMSLRDVRIDELYPYDDYRPCCHHCHHCNCWNDTFLK